MLNIPATKLLLGLSLSEKISTVPVNITSCFESMGAQKKRRTTGTIRPYYFAGVKVKDGYR